MSLNKREQAQLERRLVQALTEACETAKAEISGFEWLTHTIDHACLEASVRVIWVFDTEARRLAALAAGQQRRMVEFTGMALLEAGVNAKALERQVSTDSEEACQRSHGGDWQRRLRHA